MVNTCADDVQPLLGSQCKGTAFCSLHFDLIENEKLKIENDGLPILLPTFSIFHFQFSIMFSRLFPLQT